MKYVKWESADITDEEIQSVLHSLRTGYVGSGDFVKRFEAEFAKKIGARYAIAVNNGTSGLLCSLLALKAAHKDLVIGVPTFTFIASANAASFVAKRIRLLDCNVGTWNINADKTPSEINLLMTVDVGGLPCDYDALGKLGIPIIADSAESAGARYKGEAVGKQAEVHVFSLHRSKIIATGEGGMITTNNKDLYEAMRRLANHGYGDRRPWEYVHAVKGLNFRMTDLEASIGIVQLKKLDKYVAERRKKASIYKDIIGDLVEYQREPKYALHPYFFFGIIIKEDASRFCAEMFKRNIEVRTWAPVHKQMPYREEPGEFPNADYLSERVVLLPIHNRLSEEDVKTVSGSVVKLIKQLD
jgi:perosamine synthetase